MKTQRDILADDYHYTSTQSGEVVISTESNLIAIRTKRLVLASLNQYNQADLISNYTRLLANPKNVEMFREGQAWSEQQIIDLISSEVHKLNSGNRFCALSVHNAATKIYMGVLFIEHTLDKFNNIGVGHPNTAEISYVLDEPFWGQGYGTEIAIAGKKYIEHLIFTNELENPPEEIVATVHPNNLGSKAILQKTLKKHEPEQFISYGEPRILFFKSLRRLAPTI
jgi:RimJ/RimL family protein N-acetyltransferase